MTGPIWYECMPLSCPRRSAISWVNSGVRGTNGVWWRFGAFVEVLCQELYQLVSRNECAPVDSNGAQSTRLHVFVDSRPGNSREFDGLLNRKGPGAARVIGARVVVVAGVGVVVGADAGAVDAGVVGARVAIVALRRVVGHRFALPRGRCPYLC